MIEVELKAWVDDPAGLEAALAARFRFAGSYRKEDVYFRLERPATTAADAGDSSRSPLPERSLLQTAARLAPPQGGISQPAGEGADGSSQVVEFRLRVENGAAYVTCKEKQIAGGIEVNRETEFGVSDPVAFEAFARFLGARAFVRKVKVGRLYEAPAGGSPIAPPSVAADERSGSGSGSDEVPRRAVGGRGAEVEADGRAGAGGAVKAARAEGTIHLELSEVGHLGFFIEIEKLLERDDPGAVATAREEIRWLLGSLGIGPAKIEPRYYIDMIAAVERGERIARR